MSADRPSKRSSERQRSGRNSRHATATDRSRVWHSLDLQELLSHIDPRIVKNFFALYGAQATRYLFPLISIPYLARVLGPSSWGQVAFAQAIAAYVFLVVEYGFDLSASREMAQKRDSRAEAGQLFAAVQTAKLLLTVICCMVVVVAQITVPAVRHVGMLVWLAVMTGIFQTLRPWWSFLGMERVRLIVAVDVFSRALATVGLLVFVHNPHDTWRVLGLQLAAAVLSAAVATLRFYQLIPFVWPRWRGVIDALRTGGNMFLFRCSSALQNASNTFLVGMMSSTASVGFYSGAERLAKAAWGLMDPPSDALYPHASRLGQRSRSEAAAFVRKGTVLMFAAGLAAAIVLAILAPVIIPLVLGPGYKQSVAIFQVLAFILPLYGASLPIGVHWVMPLRLEFILTWTTLVCAAAHLCLAVFLGTHFGAIGVAWSLDLTWTIGLVLTLVVLSYKRLNPFTMARSMDPFAARNPFVEGRASE